MSPLSQRIKQRGVELGFSTVGISPAEPASHLQAFLDWIEAGMHGTMDYLARPDRVVRRRDLALILPGAQSVISVTMDYAAPALPDSITGDLARGRISNYAWSADYHAVMLSRLEILAAFVKVEAASEVSTRAYVDTGAILERDHAQRAGLGFFGKNTLLIHPRRGSYFFLGEVITNATLDFDTPDLSMPSCGTCERCMVACPTNAFPRPYVLDARRCISYLTIEHRGFIPSELRPRMGNWVYGCDVCQQVCPWQRFTPSAPLVGEFAAVHVDRAAPPLSTLLTLTDETFAEHFTGSAIYRIKRAQMVRNACIAAGNSGLEDLSALLIPLLSDASPLVRGHAAWALGRLRKGRGMLHKALTRESDQAVRQEIIAALEGSS